MLIAGFIAFCMLFGGASRGAPLQWLVIELASIAVLAVTALRRSDSLLTTDGRKPRLFLAALLLVMLSYLVPLPPELWTRIPGRSVAAETFQLLQSRPPWLPLALDAPAATAAALALLPACATYLSITIAGGQAPGFAAATIVLTATGSAVVSLGQIASGSDSQSGRLGVESGETFGLFANPNHNATLMLVGLVLLSGIAAQLRSGRTRLSQRWVAGTGIMALLTVILVSGIVLNGSLAGLILLLPALIAAVVVLRDGQPGPLPVLIGLSAMTIALLAGVLALTSPIGMNFARTGSTLQELNRVTFARNTLQALKDHLPLGSGPGSFPGVYPAYEDPSQVTNVFVNHAHNDYLEVLLELGIPGATLLAIFLYWWMRRVIIIWLGEGSRRTPLARAAVIATGLVMAHSLIDYPLRTATILTAFAACCAIMSVQFVPFVTGSTLQPQRSKRRSSHGDRPRHLSA